MSKKSITLGHSGELILEKEILQHLKVKPGEELSYKLIPGNKLILESSNDSHESSNKEIKSKGYFELTDLNSKEIKEYSVLIKVESRHLLH